MKFKFVSVCLLLVAALTLNACGGSGGDSSSSPGNQTQPGETVINGKA